MKLFSILLCFLTVPAFAVVGSETTINTCYNNSEYHDYILLKKGDVLLSPAIKDNVSYAPLGQIATITVAGEQGQTYRAWDSAYLLSYMGSGTGPILRHLGETDTINFNAGKSYRFLVTTGKNVEPTFEAHARIVTDPNGSPFECQSYCTIPELLRDDFVILRDGESITKSTLDKKFDGCQKDGGQVREAFDAGAEADDNRSLL